MLASRALAHVRLGEHDEALGWAQKAAARPNAHADILAISAWTHALAKRRDDGRKMLARIRERVPGYGVEDFLRAFRFTPEAEGLIRRAARDLG